MVVLYGRCSLTVGKDLKPRDVLLLTDVKNKLGGQIHAYGCAGKSGGKDIL